MEEINWKNWKVWAIFIVLFIGVRYCNNSGSNINKDALATAIERRLGHEVRHINSIEQNPDNPLQLRVEFEWNMAGIRERQTAIVHLYEDGTVNQIMFANDATVIGSD